MTGHVVKANKRGAGDGGIPAQSLIGRARPASPDHEPFAKRNMKAFFTVHAGEYLVGEHIEQTYPRWRVWVPSRDTGIDLLVTDSRHRKAVSLQVKSSRD
jgi:hypothetical protein